MKVVFDVINEKSGANVWTERLCSSLKNKNIQCSINRHPFFYQFIPFRFYYPSPSDTQGIIQHGNTWNGWAFKTNNPLVVTEHTAIHDHFLTPYKTALQRIYHQHIKKYEIRSLEAADCVTCTSHYVQKFLEQTFGYSDSHVILNGVDTTFFRPDTPKEEPSGIDHEKTIILFVGNLTRLKGADLLPRIMELLGDRFLLLLSSGFKGNVQIKQDNILNIGTLDQNTLVKTYNSCDIFLSTSRLEGFGLSIAEAMSCGKPIIATNCSAIPELVIDGRGGYLCEINNVNDFAEKISCLAENGDERIRMGRYNRERVKEFFNSSVMVDQYIKIYKSL